jgi:hypothetical protein
MNSKYMEKWRGPLALVVAGFVLLAVGIIISFANQTDRGVTALNANSTDGVMRVSREDASRAYSEGSAVLVDVRSTSSYDSGHIPGSLSIPISELETRAAELSRGDWIITICA